MNPRTTTSTGNIDTRNTLPHITIGADLIKRVLLGVEQGHICAIRESPGFGLVQNAILDPNAGGKMLNPPVKEDPRLGIAAYENIRGSSNSQSYKSMALTNSLFEHDSNMDEYNMDDLSSQGLNGSGDDPMLTIGMDQDSCGTNEHSSSDLMQVSDQTYSSTHDKLQGKKGRPAKGFSSTGSEATASPGRFGVRCPACDKPFNNSSALAKHKLTHSDERKYVCNTCKKTFKRQDHLNGHMLTHSAKKPFECRFKDCGKSYCDARSLKRHLEHHHAVDSSLLPSYDPSATATQAPNVSSSSFTNFQEQCSPNSSASSSSVGSNDKAHGAVVWSTPFNILEEQLPHKCSLCGRSFKNLPALNGHMRLHGGYFQKDGTCDESVWSSVGIKKKHFASSVSGTSSGNQTTHKILSKFLDVVSTSGDSGVQIHSNPMSSLLFTPPVTTQMLDDPTRSARDSLTQTDIAKVVAPNISISCKPDFLANSQMGGEASRFPELAHHIKIVNISPFGVDMRNSATNKEFMKIGDTDLYGSVIQEDGTYLMSDHQQIADLIESNGGVAADVASASKSFVTAVQPPHLFYHIGSVPISLEYLSMPKLDTPIPVLSQGDVNSELKRSFPQLMDHSQTRQASDDQLLQTCYKSSSDTTLTQTTFTQEEEPLSEEQDDTSSTDSVKSGQEDSDEEEAPHLDIIIPFSDQETRAYERRRWASADADVFTIRRKSWSSPNGLTVVAADISDVQQNIESDLNVVSTVYDEIHNIETSGRRTDGEFRNPSLSPALMMKFRRKHRPEPLVIPKTNSSFAFHSQLRSPRIGGGRSIDIKPSSFMPYTPPPMLSPIRNGSGLFCLLASQSPLSAPVGMRIGQNRRKSFTLQPFAPDTTIKEEEEIDEPEVEEGIEEETVVEIESHLIDPPPQTDISPHVNIGPEYQAETPDFNPNRLEAQNIPNKENLIWDPDVLANVRESEVRSFMDFACCAAVPFNGINKEYAHHLLSICLGNIQKAALKLMQRNLKLPLEHTLHSYIYQESDVWSENEIKAFQDGLVKCDKDFFKISCQVGTKSVQKCIQFYYLWKKIAMDEHKRLRIIRRKKEQENLYNLRSTKVVQEEDLKTFNCDDVLHLPFASYTDVAANGVGGSLIVESDLPFSNFHDLSLQYEVTIQTEEYPCKICGKVFSKVKSRSAHMKTHRPTGNGPQQTDNYKPQADKYKQTYSAQESWQFSMS